MLDLNLFRKQIFHASLHGLVDMIPVSHAAGPGLIPGWEDNFVVFLLIPPIFRGRFKGVPTGGY